MCGAVRPADAAPARHHGRGRALALCAASAASSGALLGVEALAGWRFVASGVVLAGGTLLGGLFRRRRVGGAGLRLERRPSGLAGMLGPEFVAEEVGERLAPGSARARLLHHLNALHIQLRLESMGYDELYALFPGNAAPEGAAPEAIARLACRPPKEGDSCSICLDTHAGRNCKQRVLLCGHAFHAGCVDKWLRIVNQCPVCRATGAGETAASPTGAKRAERGAHER